MSESQNLKLHERTTLLLFSQALVFVFEKFFNAAKRSQCVEIWGRAGAIWTMRDRGGNARLGGIQEKKSPRDPGLKTPMLDSLFCGPSFRFFP